MREELHNDELTAPWEDAAVQKWIYDNDAWRKFLELVRGTLANDPKQFPHQIRAAVSLVIMLCRSGLWPAKGGQRDLDGIVNLAKHQLMQIKQRFATQARANPQLAGEPQFKQFMKSLDQELRILDARMADEPLTLPDESPCTWGDFWNIRWTD